MPIVSILMPVYNSQKYLDYSIGSVLEQTFQDWELLCVDDGSTDDSWNILLNYAQQDNRIKCMKQSNAGPLAARRLGFENSLGKYIIYLDSDDAYSSDLLESLYNKAIVSNADAIAPDMVSKSSEREVSWNKRFAIDTNEELSGIEGFCETFPWRKLHNFNLWKRNVFQESTYHPYLDGNNFNADEILQRILLLNCKKIVYSASGIYIHTINPDSITHILQKRSFNRLDANEKLIQLAKDNDLSAKIINQIYSFAFFCQLKSLMLDYYSKNNFSPEECKWAMNLMEIAYKRYTSHPMNNIYGEGFVAKIKKIVQTTNFPLFKLLCYLQVHYVNIKSIVLVSY